MDIYDPNFVKSLFDEMSKTYGLINYIASFGFCERWRRQCVQLATINPGMIVYDLMTGMGECWNLINKKLNNDGRIVAIDISEEMCNLANKQKKVLPYLEVDLINEDFLANSIPDGSADCVISSFGFKTFSDSQKVIVAREIERILKQSGTFSLVEISVPNSKMLRIPYMAYLRFCIPLVGKIFLGNPDNYRLLGAYTERFENFSFMKKCLEEAGLTVDSTQLFFGCATALYGTKRPLLSTSGA
jgi:ubiquinone/menaquinone biosynthesis methyltransferase